MPAKPDPEPLEVDDVRVVLVGTALWTVALVVLAVLRAAGSDVRTWWIVMCACGAVLGVLGVVYCRRRRDAIARDRAADQATGRDRAATVTSTTADGPDGTAPQRS